MGTKKGDSWTEELGFSEREFRTAFKSIGVAYISKTKFIEAGDKMFLTEKGEEKMYCSYHDKIGRRTYYFRNQNLIDINLRRLRNAISEDTQTQSRKINKCNPDITEKTSEKTSKKTNSIYTDEISKKISKDDKKIKDSEKNKSRIKTGNIVSIQTRGSEPSSSSKTLLTPSFNWKTPEGVYEDYVKHCVEMGPRMIWNLIEQDFYGEKRVVQTQLDVSGEQFAEIIMSLMGQFGRINPGASTLCYKDEQWQALEEMVENRKIGVGGVLDFIRMRDFQDRRENGGLTEEEREIEGNMMMQSLPPCKTPVSFKNESKKLLAFVENYKTTVELLAEQENKNPMQL